MTAVSPAAQRARAWRRRLLRNLTAGSVLLSGFLCGFNLRQWAPALTAARGAAHGKGDLSPLDTYDRLLDAIKGDYAGGSASDPSELSARKLTYAGIDGMLATIGDRYTEFWTPEEYRDNMEETTGNFVGIGAKLDVTPDKRVVVIEAIEGSPAAKAGIQPGDIVTQVDGKSVAGQDVDAVINLIRGEENTWVSLTVQRNGRLLPMFHLKRSVVHNPIVEWRMEDPARRIGYIQLGMFNENADDQFDAALSKLERQGMRALIFDLRDNPGGLLQVAQDLASRFIPDGPIVWVKEKNGHLSSLDVEKDHHRSPLYKGAYPVVVLVNGGSASAAEIVSGAIQDAGAGTLIGTRTYGKGLVQTIMPLADESAVKITTQHYYTRDKHDINVKRDEDGRIISGVGGIVPNITVDFTDKDYNTQRDFLRRDPKNKLAADRLDPQMAKALETLAARL